MSDALIRARLDRNQLRQLAHYCNCCWTSAIGSSAWMYTRGQKWQTLGLPPAMAVSRGGETIQWSFGQYLNCIIVHCPTTTISGLELSALCCWLELLDGMQSTFLCSVIFIVQQSNFDSHRLTDQFGAAAYLPDCGLTWPIVSNTPREWQSLNENRTDEPFLHTKDTMCLKACVWFPSGFAVEYRYDLAERLWLFILMEVTVSNCWNKIWNATCRSNSTMQSSERVFIASHVDLKPEEFSRISSSGLATQKASSKIQTQSKPPFIGAR